MKKITNKPVITLVASTDITITAFFINHLKFLTQKYKIIVITNFKDNEFLKEIPDVDKYYLPIKRNKFIE